MSRILFIVLVLLVQFYLWKVYASAPSTIQSRIPKIVWTYWNSAKIPQFIHKCFNNWKIHNSDWDIRILTPMNITKYLNTDVTRFKHADSSARIADFVRLEILEKYGGIWMDASMLCSENLSWVLKKQQEKDAEFVGFFLAGYTTNSQYPVIENWFLAAVPNSVFTL